MKLRILGDSLRLRLSQSEVQAMGEQGRVEDAIRFGVQGPRLAYAVVADEGASGPTASFTQTTITVRLPAADVRAWIDSDQVGFDEVVDGTRIIVEKDFKCVVPREGEETYDGFPNPNSTC